MFLLQVTSKMQLVVWNTFPICETGCNLGIGKGYRISWHTQKKKLYKYDFSSNTYNFSKHELWYIDWLFLTHFVQIIHFMTISAPFLAYIMPRNIYSTFPSMAFHDCRLFMLYYCRYLYSMMNLDPDLLIFCIFLIFQLLFGYFWSK